MDPDREHGVFDKLIPVLKSLSYSVAMTMIAPMVLKKIGTLANSDISFSFDVYNLVKKWSSIKLLLFNSE